MRCPCCLEVIQSMHCHDYVVCGCPNRAMVDGGGDYLRTGHAAGGKRPVFAYPPPPTPNDESER
jgi:hypothetical protein